MEQDKIHLEIEEILKKKKTTKLSDLLWKICQMSGKESVCDNLVCTLENYFCKINFRFVTSHKNKEEIIKIYRQSCILYLELASFDINTLCKYRQMTDLCRSN